MDKSETKKDNYCGITTTLILTVLLVFFTTYTHMESVKMDMVKEYVKTETRVDSVLIVTVRRLEHKLDSLTIEMENLK